MKRILAFLIAAMCVVSLGGCHRKKGEWTVYGFVDKETGIEYVDVAPFGLYAVNRGEEFIKVGDGDAQVTYYEVQFESTEDFLCFEDSGEFLLVRNKEVEEPTIETFNPVAAAICDGNNQVEIARLYSDEQFIPEDIENGIVGDHDSALCQKIAQAIVEGEDTTVEKVSEEDRYYIRLLSKDYPGLYYMVVFFGNDAGRYFLRDRATGKTVYCPYDVIARMVGA